MDKISINLLPRDFLVEETKRSKFYKVQTICISIILFMIFLSILTISLIILQNGYLKNAQLQVGDAQAKVSSLSDKQAELVILKNRLSSINQYLGTPSKQAEMYNIVNSLIPPTVAVSSVSVGSDGTVTISAVTSDSSALDQLFTDLLNKDKNEGKITTVSIDALNRGRDGVYRVSFKVEGKK